MLSIFCFHDQFQRPLSAFFPVKRYTTCSNIDQKGAVPTSEAFFCRITGYMLCETCVVKACTLKPALADHSSVQSSLFCVSSALGVALRSSELSWSHTNGKVFSKSSISGSSPVLKRPPAAVCRYPALSR